MVAVPPPVEIPAGNVLKSALAGGLSCALSTALMHPVDTVKVFLFSRSICLFEFLSYSRAVSYLLPSCVNDKWCYCLNFQYKKIPRKVKCE